MPITPIQFIIGAALVGLLIWTAASSIDGKLRLLYLQYKLRDRNIILKFSLKQYDERALDLKAQLTKMMNSYRATGKLRCLSVDCSDSMNCIRDDEILVLLECKQSENEIAVDLQFNTRHGLIRDNGVSHWGKIFNRKTLEAHGETLANETAMVILEILRIDQKNSFQID